MTDKIRKRCQCRKLFFLFITLLVAAKADSQVVNIEEKRVKQENGIQGDMGFHYNLTKTSQTSVHFGNNVKLQYFHKKHSILAFNDIAWARVDTNNYVNSGFQHLRYNYQLSNEWLIMEAFVQHQYNKLTGIERRFLAGFGPRICVADKEKFRFFTGPLSMFEYEQLTNETKNNHWRLSWYISADVKLGSVIAFNLVNYYQPDWFHFVDFRISTEANIKFTINEHLKFKTGMQLNYDSHQPQGIDKLNYQLRNSLVFAF